MIDKKALALLLATLGLLFVAPPSRSAESYPANPIRIVVPYAPGGGNDVMARLLSKRLSETLGKTVFVDNRPGAATAIGTQSVAKSPPDGYTLILADRPLVTNPFVYSNLQYDPIKDFEPVSLLGSAPVVLAVNPKAPFQSIGEFIAYAKNQPGIVIMGSSGAGTTTHIAGELFQLRTGVKLNHVAYKGAGPAINDIIAGQIHCIFSPVGSVIPLVNAGRLRALAISTPKRAPALPDVPTFDEVGIADYRVSNWYGILAPAGTPKAVVATLNKAIAGAIQAPEVKDWLEKSLVIPGTSTPEEFVAFIKSETSSWAQVIKTAGIKAE